MSIQHNADRATWAEAALRTFCCEVGVDDECDAVHDLIADLGHYCSQHKLDFVSITARALSVWANECQQPDGTGASPQVTVTIAGRRPKLAWRNPPEFDRLLSKMTTKRGAR
jgi:hypothetical protein